MSGFWLCGGCWARACLFHAFVCFLFFPLPPYPGGGRHRGLPAVLLFVWASCRGVPVGIKLGTSSPAPKRSGLELCPAGVPRNEVFPDQQRSLLVNGSFPRDSSVAARRGNSDCSLRSAFNFGNVWSRSCWSA